MAKANKKQNKTKKTVLNSKKQNSRLKIETAIVKAESYFKTGRYEQLLETLEPFESDYPFGESRITAVYDRLIAFAYASTKQVEKAEQIINRSDVLTENSLDYIYIRAFVAKSLNENDRAIEFGFKYLKLFDEMKSLDDISEYAFSKQHLAQMHNIIGLAYFEKGQLNSSEEELKSAITANPANHFPYLNLARLYRCTDRFDDYRTIIAEGLKNCHQIQELRMLEKFSQNLASISACMIVKDEEKYLPGCLDSIRSWVDEIIVVDTGSSDKTVAIAESYGAKIYHQQWENNFSKHRNYSIEQATGDWVLIIDADERVEAGDVPKLLEVVNSKEANVISVDVHNVCDDDEVRTTFLHSNRLFRRELNLRYEGIVHNLLVVPPDQPVWRTRIKFKHLGYNLSEEELIKKISRSKPLIEKQLADNPNHAFARYNLSQILLAEGKNRWEEFAPQIIENSKKAVELTDPNIKGQRHIHLMALFQVAVAYAHLKEYEPAIEYCQTALEIKKDFLDPMLLLGQIYSNRGQYIKSDENYIKYINTHREYDPSLDDDSLILIHPNNVYDALNGMAANAEMAGDPENAKKFYRRIYDYNKTALNTAANLGRLAIGENNIAKARKYFEEQLQSNPNENMSVLGMSIIGLLQKDETIFETYFIQAKQLNYSDNQFQLLFKAAQTYQSLGKIPEAIELYELAGQIKTDSILLENLATAHLTSGQFNKATLIYERLLEDDPTNSEYLNDLGNCYFQLQKYEQAVQYYTRSSEATFTTPVVYRNLGLARARLGQFSEAIQSLAKYNENVPEDISASNLLADILLSHGEFNRALGYYEQLLKRNPHNETALFGLSECYLNMGHRDSAIMGFTQLLRLNPEHKMARNRLNNIDIEKATIN